MKQFSAPNCILRIVDQFNQFVKDVKVENLDPSNQNPTPKDIIGGVPKKIFERYVEDLHSDTCKVYLYIPQEMSKEDLLQAWNDRDVVKAKSDIDNILSSLTEEQKAALLSQYKN